MTTSELTGRRVAVLGLGVSGRAAAALARDLGARVVGLDRRLAVAPIAGVELELGPHRPETVAAVDTLIVSPGVPADLPVIEAARSAGVEVVGELAFAWQHVKLPTAAITGTNGKSTVTWFLGQILQRAGRRPFVGGNLGRPAAEAPVAASQGGLDSAVLEVSSYQLEHPGSFRPDVGVVLNLTPDHLSRHGTLERYGRVKCRLFAGMEPQDLAIVPWDDPQLATWSQEVGEGRRAWLGGRPGVWRNGERVTVALDDIQQSYDLSELSIPGDHNLDHAATAALLAVALGVDADAIQAALGTLEPLPHRMEVVGELDGVTWINDSKATNVEAVRVGLAGLRWPAVVLLGGRGKDETFEPLLPLLQRQRAVILFGESGPTIARALERGQVAHQVVGGLRAAMEEARRRARPGDAVVLSPGGASFDEFESFEARGEAFRGWVQGRRK